MRRQNWEGMIRVQGIRERGEGGKFSGMIIFHYTYIYEVLKVKPIVIQHGELLHTDFRISKEQDPCWYFIATSSLSSDT